MSKSVEELEAEIHRLDTHVSLLVHGKYGTEHMRRREMALKIEVTQLKKEQANCRLVLINYGEHNSLIERVMREARLELKTSIPKS